jgi:hypothetical protein
MNIKSKQGNTDLNGFQMIWLGILLFLFYWMIWANGVQYAVDTGDSKVPSQWDGFGACWVFTAVVYVFVKFCRKIGGW